MAQVGYTGKANFYEIFKRPLWHGPRALSGCQPAGGPVTEYAAHEPGAPAAFGNPTGPGSTRAWSLPLDACTDRTIASPILP